MNQRDRNSEHGVTIYHRQRREWTMVAWRGGGGDITLQARHGNGEEHTTVLCAAALQLYIHTHRGTQHPLPIFSWEALCIIGEQMLPPVLPADGQELVMDNRMYRGASVTLEGVWQVAIMGTNELYFSHHEPKLMWRLAAAHLFPMREKEKRS